MCVGRGVQGGGGNGPVQAPMGAGHGLVVRSDGSGLHGDSLGGDGGEPGDRGRGSEDRPTATILSARVR